MIANEARRAGFGRKIGFITMFFIFTTALYFFLFSIGKLPENFTYLHVMLITLFIILTGTLLKFLLK